MTKKTCPECGGRIITIAVMDDWDVRVCESCEYELEDDDT